MCQEYTITMNLTFFLTFGKDGEITFGKCGKFTFGKCGKFTYRMLNVINFTHCDIVSDSYHCDMYL